MSFDRLKDRNRNLSQEGFNSADLINAVVTDHDNEEVARYKLSQQQAESRSALSGSDTGVDYGSGGLGVVDDVNLDRTEFVIKAILWGIGIFLITSVLGALWSAKDELFDYWKESRRAEAADERIKEYADFSNLSQWPERVQKTYRNQENKPLEKLMDEVPRDLNKLSATKRHALGAQIWFKVSSKGAGASDYLDAVQKAPHRVAIPVVRATTLSVQFLQNECQKGFELACLDAAKSYAGLVWHGKGSAQQGWVLESALGQLPSSGPLAKSPAIEALRAKLLATRKSLAQ